MIYYRFTEYANLKFFSKLYEVKDYKNKKLDVAKEFNIQK